MQGNRVKVVEFKVALANGEVLDLAGQVIGFQIRAHQEIDKVPAAAQADALAAPYDDRAQLLLHVPHVRQRETPDRFSYDYDWALSDPPGANLPSDVLARQATVSAPATEPEFGRQERAA